MPKQSKTVQKKTKSNAKPNIIQQLEKLADNKAGLDLYYLIKSRCRIVYVVSPEETRILHSLRMITRSEGYDLFRWDCHNGLCDITASDDFLGRQVADCSNEIHKMPLPLMSHLMEHARNDNIRMNNDEDLRNEGKVYVLLDFHPYMQMNNIVLNRIIKDFSMMDSARHIVIVSPRYDCPDTLDKVISVLDYPYPSKEELKIALFNIKRDIRLNYPEAVEEANRRENDILDAASGMTLYEAENAFASSFIRTRTFNIPVILQEKRQVIRKNGILDYIESKLTFDDVGGLDALKDWFSKRRDSFSIEAKEYGLPMAKGVMLAGHPGTGKSLICEALASFWERPLLRLDMGAIFNSHIGQSESNIRQAIKTAEAISPAILWVDEIEKGIGGVRSSNVTDGGVTNRVFASLLTWMQEKTAPVFIICTANDTRQLPPEFMRAGRFDEIFFLDLPTYHQRMEVIEKLLRRKKRDANNFSVDKIAEESENYSPAELEKGINDALFYAFHDGRREIVTDDILNALSSFQPLYNSKSEDIAEMREWALGEDGQGGNARLANAISDKKPPQIQKRNISINEELSL